MDISILNILAIGAIFIPLIFALYLITSRLNLSYVNKKVLNYGTSVVNFISFAIFSTLYFLSNQGEILNFNFNFFSLEKFSLNFGLLINENNIIFLIFASLLCLIVSLYSKFYFDKKKQFIFTKQRFYAFLSFLSFLGYIFLSSINLFQGTIILILQSIAVFVFSYFDIFKNPTNHNIVRFHRISHIGNFALLCAVLMLFRYSILSQGYISSNSLDYNELNVLVSYMYGISSSIEFKLMTACFIFAIMSRLMIFPLSCYYSFFANSSNVLYLAVSLCANNLMGIFLFLKVMPLLELSEKCVFYLEIFLVLAAILSFIQMFFEKNIKIFFGYLLSIINSSFIVLFLNFNTTIIKYCYFGINILFAIILMHLFIKDKINFKKRIINRNLGFLLEKSHIVLFEIVPDKISKFVEIIDEKIIQNLILIVFKTIDWFATLFVIKTTKNRLGDILRNILISFALITIFAIFVALFWRL
ncbi:MAG: hypothetical protein IJW73_00250 [Candidatus Gastranaerophilales bacterium]|nr:hypothetical protein [Candidatus Gastranaerophilales bacterium]